MEEPVHLYAPAGERALPSPGDLILTHGSSFLNRFVQFGQRARMLLARPRPGTRGDRKDWCHYDHVAVYVGLREFPDRLGFPPDTALPAVIEALPGGVRVTPLDFYDDREYHVVDVSRCADPFCRGSGELAADERDRAQMVAYVQDCLGLEYGLLWHYVGMIITTLTGGGLTFSGAQQEICSSMAAQAMVRSFHTFDRPAPSVQPADLARHWDVRPPRPPRG